MKKLFFIVLIVALLSVLISGYALLQLNQVKHMALSELSFAPKQLFNTPVLDQKNNRFGMISIYEYRITNDAGPPVNLLSVEGSERNTDFVVALKDDKVTGGDFNALLFTVPYSVKEIQKDPAKLRDCMQNGTHTIEMDHLIESGATHRIRIGISFHPYDEQQKPLADYLLTSLIFKFDNQKHYTVRQGFRVIPFHHKNEN